MASDCRPMLLSGLRVACAMIVALMPVSAMAANARCEPLGTPLVWQPTYACYESAEDAGCRLAALTAKGGSANSAAIVPLALGLARQLDATGGSDVTVRVSEAELYLIAAANVQSRSPDQARTDYALAIARLASLPQSEAEAQCARQFALAGLAQLDPRNIGNRQFTGVNPNGSNTNPQPSCMRASSDPLPGCAPINQ
jgi:hypothetical protein